MSDGKLLEELPSKREFRGLLLKLKAVFKLEIRC